MKPQSKIERIIVPSQVSLITKRLKEKNKSRHVSIFTSQNPSECICQLIVLLPNNNRVQISCKPDATVRTIYETVVTYVDLIEQNLFALAMVSGMDIDERERDRCVLFLYRWRILFSFDGFESVENSSRIEMEDGSTGICHAIEDKILCQ